MRSLDPPRVTSAQVLELCLLATTDAELQSRLDAVTTLLEQTATSYDANAVAETLDLIPRITSVGAVTKAELIALYYDHFSATNGAAKTIYDQIRNAAPNKKCPLCGIGTVATLDHHLPKSKYPDLSIVPSNLVPACHFCNDKKRARYPRNRGEQTLHPYFDNRLLNSRWVKASLHQGPPPVLIFTASPPVTWPMIDRERVQRHFTVCGLAITFASNGNDELSLLRDRLLMLGQRGGTAAVRGFLEEEVSMYSPRQNCWQLSMYEALVSDTWFINGGFRLIA